MHFGVVCSKYLVANWLRECFLGFSHVQRKGEQINTLNTPLRRHSSSLLENALSLLDEPCRNDSRRNFQKVEKFHSKAMRKEEQARGTGVGKNDLLQSFGLSSPGKTKKEKRDGGIDCRILSMPKRAT
ncbi:hypothetical protein CEXT_341921 [Caerostris extrusa]|uniref:Uncharacterized protein n=1 Tax=Caerostris extrusa TaxID=172846 RepID=A0AAV4P877_CAEEX|nr:hypothetical protein CEXT_341921 [Caerostris extrusa]